MIYETRTVTEISFETLTQGHFDPAFNNDNSGNGTDSGYFPLSDHGAQALEAESFQNKESLINILTARQKEVVELLASGMTREQAAEKLTPPVCVQAIHQIVLRIRKRLVQKAGVPMTGWRRTHGK